VQRKGSSYSNKKNTQTKIWTKAKGM